MTKQVQFRRGTTAQHTTFTGALAEITVDTDKKVAVVHDGSTAGGFELVGRTATQTLTNKTLSTPTFTGNPILGDNVILHFGSATASTGDLQVKSDGTTSYIEERTSALRIYSNDLYLQDYTNAKIYLRAQASGSVQLNHNNSLKLETTATGATVTGTLTATALSTGASGTGVNINATGTITGPATITIDPAAIGDDTGTVEIKGNLTVQGTTTTINSTTSVIADPLIELRKGTSITAADGGIQVNLTTDGAGAVTGYQRIQWNNTFTRWETTDGTTAKPIVNTIDSQTIDGSKSFVNNLTASGSNATIQFSPTGTGTVTISPATAGTINNMSIGATTKASGAFTTLAVKDTSANFDVAFVPTSSTALTANRNLTFDVVNAARTIKLAGNIDIANNLTTSGNFALTLTTTNTTNVTLPTSGTLLTTSGSGSSLTFGTGSLSLAGNLTTSGAFAVTLTATAATNVTLPTTGTLATLTNTTFVGTTSIALNRTSAELALTGITGFSTVAATGANSTGISIITGATTTSGNSGDVSIDVGAAATTLGVINIATTNATTVNVGSTSKNTTLNVRGNATGGTATIGTNVTTGIVNLFTGVTGTINLGTTGAAIVVPEPATSSSAATKSYVDAMAVAMGL